MDHIIILTMKKIIFILAFIPMISFGQTTKTDNAITVVGIAEKEIEPDWLILGMSTKETENIKKKSEIVTMENSILSFIISLGLDSSSFSIDRYSANTKHSYSASSKYKLSKSYRLKIDDIALLDTIIAKCLESDMDNVYVNQIGHSQIDSIQNQVLVDALKSARLKADIISKTMGITLSKVISVNETYHVINNNIGSYQFDDYRLESVVVTAYGAQRKGRAGSSLSFQKIQLKKTVIVKYEIE